MIPHIDMAEFNYDLPDERIAKYPLARRDMSKLLEYDEGVVSDHCFGEIASLLPEGAMMVFNDTKVVPARLHFQKDSGAAIEIFCLEPVHPNDYALIFNECESCVWRCIVGNSKKWKQDSLSLYLPEGGGHDDLRALDLKAELVAKEGRTAVVRFCWKGGTPFSAVLELCGNVPIPPYLNRETEDIDLERYQTLYARFRGSVAAPTAGLHFTEEVLEEISRRGISRETVCLHVGAGTFLPVKGGDISSHEMHREPVVVKRGFLERLLANGKGLVAVGTTSVRTLESLYYAGVKCLEQGFPSEVGQWEPYERSYPYTTEEALQAIIEYLDREKLEALNLGTRIIIVPGFRFRIVDHLVTNFHQPQSTLLLLISAFVGGDWRRIYDHAMANGYRFLSYGDSSLLHRR
ncbi:MAG: S-adenosylmethionine:tRNA ribosyltransferase-isomerase [Bacteroidales bacterium]|nr:S-adenosylmethionine:tRNA ribosyltransferase-isomerase [Bacteroidales bacterium]